MDESADMTSVRGKPDFHVVGIGASAGGLDALRSLFAHMPEAPGFACVIVVHLSPEHESHLVELLQPYTHMPVSQVVTTTILEPNHVYVIPPNANLNSIDTHLRLSELEAQRIRRAPIDHFLRTLAGTHGESAIGVILSGAGSDGALGLRQIREQGGLTIAQIPEEAECPGMPQSAIATGAVDLVLGLENMPQEIVAYCRSSASARLPQSIPTEEELLLLEKIIVAVRQSIGDDLAMYRRSILLRRVQRRMRLRHVARLPDYLGLLQSQSGEAEALRNEVLLNVTEFFRDADTYRTLEQMLREIVQRKDPGRERVRVWCIGCSTGEEAYSLAMLLLEQASRRGEGMRLQVFATELSPESLQRARDGVYPAEIAGTMSKKRLDRFFTYEGGHYHVRNDLRGIVTFSSHNLFKDPPYAHLDLIVCRHLLRELEPQIRRGMLNLFHYALDAGGMLLLDAVGDLDATGQFDRVSEDPRVLRRRDGPGHVGTLPPGLAPFKPAAQLRGERIREAVRFDTTSVYLAAIARYVPPSVLIDAGNQVIHFSSTASRYVQIPGGELTLDIMNIVSPVIGYKLLAGLEAARRDAPAWQSEPFAVATDGGFRNLVLRVDRIEPVTDAPIWLIVFDDSLLPAGGAQARASDATPETPQREIELSRVQRQLTAAHAALSDEAGRLEARRQRGEELRHTVEELENTREELQSVNEELKAFIDENHHRVVSLARLASDLKHVLESTGIATVLVDTASHIVRYTALASEVFRVQPADIGRPLFDIRHSLRYSGLAEQVRKVLEGEADDVEQEVESLDGRWFLLRIQPYRSALHGLEGAVIVLVDNTSRKRAELSLREADRHKDEFLAMLAHELRNPLAAIRSGVEVLSKAPENSDVLDRISSVMRRQTQQLVRLVDDLLEVGRINTGKLTLRMEPARVADVVRDAVTAVRPLIENARHELTTFISEDPLVVEGDAVRLTQVVANLLNNAARYTPAGGRIAIAARQEEGTVVITVKDSGRGISAQALPKLFDMYYQESAPDRDRGAGLGIGLTLAKKLVEMHAGSIAAESSGPNRGSTFTVRLPLASPVSVEHAHGEVDPQRRILVVDDNTDAAEALSMLLMSIGGGEVRAAFSGEEALKLGAQVCPDVILLDLGMPDMDGYEVARRIRRESWGKDVLLVALSGWGQDQHRHRTREAGFDRHLTKPAEIEELRAVLRPDAIH